MLSTLQYPREAEYLQLHEQTVSLTENNQGLRAENSGLRQQLAAQRPTVARIQTLRQENQRLKDEVDAKDAKIRRLDGLVYQLEESVNPCRTVMIFFAVPVCLLPCVLSQFPFV